MHKSLLKCLLLVFIFSSCVAVSPRTTDGTYMRNSSSARPALTSDFRDLDTARIMQPDLTAGKSPVSLMELPRTEEGGFILSPGFYEADFKTYCLQPGTPGPTATDVYFQAPFEGARKELTQTILLNSRKQAGLEQKNIQLLLWSVVSRSDFYKLSPDVQFAATQLLTPKQLFELQGGVLGIVKTVARVLPTPASQSDIRKLFDMSVRSYEAFEQLAVLNTPSRVWRTDLKQDQWLQHEEGYFVRYIPNSYKQTRIQVYVPEGIVDSAALETGNYMVFDPTSWVLIPANSNAQQIGIGGPVLDIVRTVIRGIKSGKGSRRPPKANTGKSSHKNPQAIR